MQRYTVWAGGVEVTNDTLTKEDAENLAQEYRKDGYSDVIVEIKEQ